MDNEVMDKILKAMPETMTNAEIAAMLATICSAFSGGNPLASAMHLNEAQGMILARSLMEGEKRTIN
jgi:hypothetical protein